MKKVIIIPAREGSTRFPAKPLAKILEIPLIERVWKIARSVRNADEVFVATDSQAIAEVAEKFGAKVVMTSPECQNGSERTFEALQKLQIKPDIAVNLQGDAVLIPPWVIEDVIHKMTEETSVSIATPAIQLNKFQFDHYLKAKNGGRASGTLVVFDLSGNALYFSKGIIPHLRSRSENPPIYRHIGLYGYRYPVLEKYVSLKPSPLEEAEKLEQLRALENGIPIKVVLVDYRGRTPWSIDNPEDIAVAENIIRNEGELF